MDELSEQIGEPPQDDWEEREDVARCRMWDVCLFYQQRLLTDKVEESMCGRGEQEDRDYVPKFPGKLGGMDPPEITCDAYSYYLPTRRRWERIGKRSR